MVTRRPLVVQDGYIAELPVGDTVTAGTSTTQVVAGSGLVGGGSVSMNPRVDLALAPNPSGVIYVGDALGIDGFDQVTSNAALASGSAAAVLASAALASGNSSLVTATAALASGNAALSLIPAPGPGGNFARFTAASAIASGYPVGVDDTGKVQSVRNATLDNSNPMVSENVSIYTANYDLSASMVYDSVNNAIVVSYRDLGNSNYGTTAVGRFTGSTLSFGTPVVFLSADPNYVTSSFDASVGRVIVFYTNPSLSAISGVVSGTSITFGAATASGRFAGSGPKAIFDSTNNKSVVVYIDSNGYGTAVVVTASGTTASFGTSTTFISASIANKTRGVVHDSSNNRIVIAYQNNSDLGIAVVGQISGSSISFGSNYTFSAVSTSAISVGFSSATGRCVIAYAPTATSTGSAVVGTVAGLVISFGTPTQFDTTANLVQESAITYDVNANKIVIYYNYYIRIVAGQVSGTSISFGTPLSFSFNTTGAYEVVYGSVNKQIYSLRSTETFSTVRTYKQLSQEIIAPLQSSRNNILGISQSTVTSGSLCTITLPGTLYNNSTANLTTGAFYYVNPTTSGITTTSTQPSGWTGQVPWNYIGRAVSTSGLMLLKSI